jgi:hypothetical protein
MIALSTKQNSHCLHSGQWLFLYFLNVKIKPAKKAEGRRVYSLRPSVFSAQPITEQYHCRATA